jgi:nitroreductase/NAD-dependent dihydropyrimidine dehydrogenase PreA subunit
MHNFFEIDDKKCKRDGVCADECPRKIIILKDKTSVPVPADGASEQCSLCGHCVSVCPHGAFTHSKIKTEDCPPMQSELALNPEQVEHFLRSRRSIRSYKNKDIDHDTLAKLIDIAHYAPTGTNSQQVKWVAITSREKVMEFTGEVVEVFRKMVADNSPTATRLGLARLIAAWDSGSDIITRGAPGLVFAYAPSAYALGLVDCMSALSYFDLAAPSLGLGTCWAGFVMLTIAQHPQLQNLIEIPEGYTCHGAMMVGYPRYKYHRLPVRNKADINWL